MKRSVTKQPQTWATGLFDPCGKDAGPWCCVQVCCCGPCVWGGALREAGVENWRFFAFAACCGGDTCVDEAAGLLARRKLMAKYSIEESDRYGCLASCCCAPCARYQELNTVMVRETLEYSCANVTRVAAPQRIRRSPTTPARAVLATRGSGSRV